MKPSQGWIIAAVLLAGTAVAQEDEQPQGPPPAPVRVAEVVKHELTPTTLVPGTVQSRSDARIAAEVAGVLEWVAEVGTRAEAGQELAHIDDTQLKLQRQEQQAVISRESARVKYLEREVERLRSLLKSNLAAKNQLEQVESDHDVARGDLGVAQARLAQINDQLQRTVIKAPFEGTVVARVSQAGERVTGGEVVVRMVDPGAREVVARAPLAYIAFTSIGEEIQMRDAEGRSATGHVRAMVPFGEDQSHLFEVRIDAPDAPWPVGQTVRVAMPMDQARQVTAVPRDALVLRPEGASVFVVDGDNKAQKVQVQAGTGDGTLIEVSGEVEPGQKVVIRGNERLQPGQAVTIQEG